MIASARHAEIYIDGKRFGGRPGRPVRTFLYPWPGGERSGEVLWLLRMLSGTLDARPAGYETVRGTSCRKFAARVGPGKTAVWADGELTVWIDGKHVRRIQLKQNWLPGPAGEPGDLGIFREVTLELWDFGVPVNKLDWSRLPSFPTSG
jgi:hypothetical protein